MFSGSKLSQVIIRSSSLFIMSSFSVARDSLFDSEGSENRRGSSSSFRRPITRNKAGLSKADVSGLRRRPRVRQPFAVLSSDSEEAINELDRELARPSFLEDSDANDSSPEGVVGVASDHDAVELVAEGVGEHCIEVVNEQRIMLGAEQSAVLVVEQNVEFGGEQNYDPPVGRPHSPTYAEYSARYHFDWPDQPHRKAVENEYPASKIASVIDEDWLGQLYRAYETPKDVFFWVPAPDERADQPPEDCVAVNLDTMEAGLRFPLHPVITRLLIEWNITITQLMPNGWHIVMSLLTLFGKTKPRYYPTAAELARLVHLSRPKGEHGWLFMQANTHRKVVEDVPNKIKDWKDKFWFVGGDWRSPASGSEPNARLDIPTDFGVCRSKCFVSASVQRTDINLFLPFQDSKRPQTKIQKTDILAVSGKSILNPTRRAR